MQRLDVQVVFIVLLVLPATVKTDEGGVQFWRDKVKLTCPKQGDWFAKNDKNVITVAKDYEFQYIGRSQYHCKYEDDDKKKITYQFYVEGKTCRNCFELSASLIMWVLIVDVVGTVIVMMIVFKWTRKKRSAGPTNSSKTPAPSGGRAPPVPNPDYEPLNPNTRAQDPYSFVNRTG